MNLVQQLGAMTTLVGSVIESDGLLDYAWLPEGAEETGWRKEDRLAQVFGLLRASLGVSCEAWGLSPETMQAAEASHAQYLRRRVERASKARLAARADAAAG